MKRRRGYDPMMCPQRYHTWSQKLREHGFEGAGDYWWDWSGREYSLISALEVVALRESYARMKEQARAIGARFAVMAEELKPAIEALREAMRPLAEAGLLIARSPEFRRLAAMAADDEGSREH